MNEFDLYNLHCGRHILADMPYFFLIGLEQKGYLITDLGKLNEEGIFVGGVKYGFDEIDKVPIKGNGLEERIND